MSADPQQVAERADRLQRMKYDGNPEWVDSVLPASLDSGSSYNLVHARFPDDKIAVCFSAKKEEGGQFSDPVNYGEKTLDQNQLKEYFAPYMKRITSITGMTVEIAIIQKALNEPDKYLGIYSGVWERLAEKILTCQNRQGIALIQQLKANADRIGCDRFTDAEGVNHPFTIRAFQKNGPHILFQMLEKTKTLTIPTTSDSQPTAPVAVEVVEETPTIDSESADFCEGWKNHSIKEDSLIAHVLEKLSGKQPSSCFQRVLLHWLELKLPLPKELVQTIPLASKLLTSDPVCLKDLSEKQVNKIVYEINRALGKDKSLSQFPTMDSDTKKAIKAMKRAKIQARHNPAPSAKSCGGGSKESTTESATPPKNEAVAHLEAKRTELQDALVQLSTKAGKTTVANFKYKKESLLKKYQEIYGKFILHCCLGANAAEENTYPAGTTSARGTFIESLVAMEKQLKQFDAPDILLSTLGRAVIETNKPKFIAKFIAQRSELLAGLKGEESFSKTLSIFADSGRIHVQGAKNSCSVNFDMSGSGS